MSTLTLVSRRRAWRCWRQRLGADEVDHGFDRLGHGDGGHGDLNRPFDRRRQCGDGGCEAVFSERCEVEAEGELVEFVAGIGELAFERDRGGRRWCDLESRPAFRRPWRGAAGRRRGRSCSRCWRCVSPASTRRWREATRASTRSLASRLHVGVGDGEPGTGGDRFDERWVVEHGGVVEQHRQRGAVAGDLGGGAPGSRIGHVNGAAGVVDIARRRAGRRGRVAGRPVPARSPFEARRRRAADRDR